MQKHDVPEKQLHDSIYPYRYLNLSGKEEYDEEKQRLYAAMNEIKGEQKALIDQKKSLNDMHRKEQKEGSE